MIGKKDLHAIRTIILKLTGNLFIIAVSFTSMFPMIWLIYSSLKTNKEFSLNIISLPRKPQFSNYINAIKIGDMDRYFINSMYVSVITVVLIILIAFITGYILSRFRFRGRNLIYLLFISGMLLPIYGSLIPVFIL